jgi:hypothetical protein
MNVDELAVQRDPRCLPIVLTLADTVFDWGYWGNRFMG